MLEGGTQARRCRCAPWAPTHEAVGGGSTGAGSPSAPTTPHPEVAPFVTHALWPLAPAPPSAVQWMVAGKDPFHGMSTAQIILAKVGPPRRGAWWRWRGEGKQRKGGGHHEGWMAGLPVPALVQAMHVNSMLGRLGWLQVRIWDCTLHNRQRRCAACGRPSLLGQLGLLWPLSADLALLRAKSGGACGSSGAQVRCLQHWWAADSHCVHCAGRRRGTCCAA